MITKNLLSVFLLGTIALSASAQTTVTVTNTGLTPRSEIVEVSRYPKGSFILRDSFGRDIPYQITHDGLLIFKASVAPGATAKFTFAKGTPAPVDTICTGRVYPERKDDLAWENDRAAYRAYGPELQRSGEKSYGYDVWTKSVPYPVVEKRFRENIGKIRSYHIDHGEGMDCYAVGSTLGGGTSAILLPTDSIIYPYCWTASRILDRGPLRFTVQMDYGTVNIDGHPVTEHRTLTLDAGSWFNRTTVTYDGLPANATPIAGTVVHDSNPQGYTLLDGAAIYTDYTQKPNAGNGEIYLGLISATPVATRYLPLPKPAADAIGHIIIAGTPGTETFTYHWGSAWSKGGVPNATAWQAITQAHRYALQHPLTVTVK